MNDNVLEIRNLVKDYPGVRAVNNVSFDIRRNTVHCLVGENGAGKSTLIKILTGAVPRTSGVVLLNGQPYCADNPREARQKGISTLFQELNVVDQLTVEENLTLGIEDTVCGFLKKTDKVNKIVDTLKNLEPSIMPQQKVSTLSVAKKQIIEIAKAVASDADIIIMDEPTAALSEAEIQKLFQIVKGLRERNVTVIYISHRLDEIFALGDYITVMRDGCHIETKKVSEVANRTELIKMMIGKTVYESYIPPEVPASETILSVHHVCNHKLKDISFTVKKGEILGFYGLVGAGKTEIARAIYGADPFCGEIIYKSQRFSPTPSRAIEAGIALVPEERRSQGLFTRLTIRNNVSVMRMKKISKHGILDRAKECKCTNDYIEQLNIVTSGMEKEVSKLSGGNQQKVVFSKCLFADADLLMLDEPTRGIDVGAKSEIYNIIRELSKAGKSVMIFSSELQEIVNMCDRIYLLYDGQIRASLENGPDIDTEKIIHVVTGGE